MGRLSADREIGRKSIRQIHRETAGLWARRAIAAFRRYGRGGHVRWAMDALGYRHEALEHAALADATGRLTGKLARAIDRAQASAR